MSRDKVLSVSVSSLVCLVVSQSHMAVYTCYPPATPAAVKRAFSHSRSFVRPRATHSCRGPTSVDVARSVFMVALCNRADHYIFAL